MCTKKDVLILDDGDEWQGLYIDGKKVTEDHRVTVADVLDALGIKLRRKEWKGHHHFLKNSHSTGPLCFCSKLPNNIAPARLPERYDL